MKKGRLKIKQRKKGVRRVPTGRYFSWTCRSGSSGSADSAGFAGSGSSGPGSDSVSAGIGYSAADSGSGSSDSSPSNIILPYSFTGGCGPEIVSAIAPYLYRNP